MFGAFAPSAIAPAMSDAVRVGVIVALADAASTPSHANVSAAIAALVADRCIPLPPIRS
jgi:hypothetical protein